MITDDSMNFEFIKFDIYSIEFNKSVSDVYERSVRIEDNKPSWNRLLEVIGDFLDAAGIEEYRCFPAYTELQTEFWKIAEYEDDVYGLCVIRIWPPAISRTPYAAGATTTPRQ